MNRHPRPLAIAAAAVLGVLLLTGCGSTPTVETPATGDAQAGQTTEAADDTTADEGETEEAPAAAAEGTRENPYPIGTVIVGDEWKVTVNSVDLDANEDIAAANEFNEPPADGKVYILVNITAEYTGDDSQGATPWATVEYVSPGGNTFAVHDDDVMMAIAPDSFDSLETLYTGASTSGNIVLAVPAETVGEGVLAVTPDMFSDKVFVAVK